MILKPSAHLQSSRRIRGELNHHSFALARFFSKLCPDAVTDLTLVTVRKAAELIVCAEAARAAVLAGGSCAADLDMLVKLEGEARRTVRALGLKLDAAKPGAVSPSLPWSPLRARINAPAKPEVTK